MTSDPTVVAFDRYEPGRPSLFHQCKRISTQDYRDGRKDNSRCSNQDC
jgi:hypothetical protein